MAEAGRADARSLFARYLEQRKRLEEGPIYVEKIEEGQRGHEVQEMNEESPSKISKASQSSTPSTRPAPAESARSWRDDLPSIPPPGIEIPRPPRDLFFTDELREFDLDQIANVVRSCSRCKLCDSRTTAVPGQGPKDAKLVVVGEGPGAKEDETGLAFVGRAGELLTEILKAIDMPREQVFICNIVKCRPPNNRKPQQDEIDSCVPFLYRQLELIGPDVILAMGGTAAETLLNTKQSLGSMRNKVHSFRGWPVIVTYHPAALLRNPHWKKPTWDDVRIARQLIRQ